jgi:hypothetical protein
MSNAPSIPFTPRFGVLLAHKQTGKPPKVFERPCLHASS